MTVALEDLIQSGDVADLTAVQAQIDTLKGGAQAAFDTLGEIQAILGSDTSGKLAALVAATWANNKFPYMTGAASLAMADLTSQGRGLLDDTSYDAMLATLGLSSDAIAAVKAGNNAAIRTSLGVVDGVADAVRGQIGGGTLIIPSLAGDPSIPPGGASDLEFDAALSTGTAFGSPTSEDANTTRKSCYYVKKTANSQFLAGRYWSWAPSAGNFVIAHIVAQTCRQAYSNAMLLVAAASNGATEGIGFRHDGTYKLSTLPWNALVSGGIPGGNSSSQAVDWSCKDIWVKIVYTSTTDTAFYYSFDGQFYFLLHTRTDLGTPTLVALAVNDETNNGVEMLVDCLRFG